MPYDPGPLPEPWAPDDPRVLFQRVVDDILTKIETGELYPNARLPSARKMAEQYGVGVMTIQRALRELQQMRITYSVAGKGTFIHPDFADMSADAPLRDPRQPRHHRPGQDRRRPPALRPRPQPPRPAQPHRPGSHRHPRSLPGTLTSITPQDRTLAQNVSTRSIKAAHALRPDGHARTPTDDEKLQRRRAMAETSDGDAATIASAGSARRCFRRSTPHRYAARHRPTGARH
jgi:DNA-binding transcriptional MocR family regulator